MMLLSDIGLVTLIAAVFHSLQEEMRSIVHVLTFPIRVMYFGERAIPNTASSSDIRS